MQAFASDLTVTFDIKCIIRDVSESGCMIVSSQIHELPDLIQLVPEGFDQPLNGRIVWRKDKMAGISFLSANSNEVSERLNQFYYSAMLETEEDEPLLLNCLARPLGNADRLAIYNPRAK